MERMFQTHQVRHAIELSECLWDFRIENGQMTQTGKAYVPGCWEQMPGLGNYRGSAVYERTLTAGGNVRLVFKGVSHTARVYVDDLLAGEHYNAYTSFDVILRALPAGEHSLRVEVSNAFGEASALHVPNDYMTYGGIIRPVMLEELGAAYIRWVHYTPHRCGDGWMLDIDACVDVLQQGANFTVDVTVHGQTCCLKGRASKEGRQRLHGCMQLSDVEPWCMESPCLYSVAAKLMEDGQVMDDLIDRIGFREVQTEDGKILLNSRPVRIKGVCRHEDYAGFGCAIPVQAMQRDLQLMQEMGCNAVRTTHYPNDERFLDLCDEQGFLVWEESHARGLSERDMRNPNFDRQCACCIDEMVEAHYNHPSIYIWGILNECASETAYGRICCERQLAQLRGLDTSRPLTFATCKFTHGEDGQPVRMLDLCLDLPDVVSCNVYPKWYFDTPVKDFLQELHDSIDGTAGRGKPMIISEIGAGGEYGYHSAENLKWSEEYQAQALQEQLEGVLDDPRCTGVYIWQYCDTRVSNEWFASRPRTCNNKGVVDAYRRPKMAFAAVKKIFREYGDYLN